MLRGAEEGVHRPVAVRRDQDHRSSSRDSEILRLGRELHPGGGQVVAVELAELVGSDLPDEARASAQRGDARRRVRGRTAADLPRRAHVRIEPLRLLGVDQAHRALRQPLGIEESVVGVGDDVDDGIADAQHVETAVGHSRSTLFLREKARA